MKIYKLKAQD